MNGRSIHKKHNAEDVHLKARPVGRCPKASLCVIAFHHARFSMQLACFDLHGWRECRFCRSKNLSKQCLDPGFWASPEFMIINQRCLKLIAVKLLVTSVLLPEKLKQTNLPLKQGQATWHASQPNRLPCATVEAMQQPFQQQSHHNL